MIPGNIKLQHLGTFSAFLLSIILLLDFVNSISGNFMHFCCRLASYIDVRNSIFDIFSRFCCLGFFHLIYKNSISGHFMHFCCFSTLRGMEDVQALYPGCKRSPYRIHDQQKNICPDLLAVYRAEPLNVGSGHAKGIYKIFFLTSSLYQIQFEVLPSPLQI